MSWQKFGGTLDFYKEHLEISSVFARKYNISSCPKNYTFNAVSKHYNFICCIFDLEMMLNYFNYSSVRDIFALLQISCICGGKKNPLMSFSQDGITPSSLMELLLVASTTNHILFCLQHAFWGKLFKISSLLPVYSSIVLTFVCLISFFKTPFKLFFF